MAHDATTTVTTKPPGTVTAISATYQGPSNDNFVVAREITSLVESSQTPASETISLAAKTNFLKDLRASVAEVQEQVNKELTARMEADKAREAGTSVTANVVNEADEEQNYGEEVVDDGDA